MGQQYDQGGQQEPFAEVGMKGDRRFQTRIWKGVHRIMIGLQDLLMNWNRGFEGDKDGFQLNNIGYYNLVKQKDWEKIFSRKRQNEQKKQRDYKLQTKRQCHRSQV